MLIGSSDFVAEPHDGFTYLDLRVQGDDTLNLAQTKSWRETIQEKHQDGERLVVLAHPPLLTFSRSRDRSVRSRLRSLHHPEGLPRLGRQDRQLVNVHNAFTSELLNIIEWSLDSLKVPAAVQHPASSHFWRLGRLMDGELGESEDYDFKKPASVKVRAWKCGDNDSLKQASSIQTWLAAVLHDRPTELEVRGEGVVFGHGRVHRHVRRGVDELSAREVRNTEDAASMAGMRNPEKVVRQWPGLRQVMTRVRHVLLRERARNPSMKGLWVLH